MKSTVEFTPTVIIGLGGTGHGVLLRLKKRFIDELGQVPPIVEFLSIDTTQEAEREETLADGTRIELEANKERYLVQVEDPSTLLNPSNPHILEWWTPGSTVSSIISGAQQIRQRGRLALFANYSEIRDRLARKLDEVRKVENVAAMKDKGFKVSERKGVNVYVVSSLAGGTGSGMFLDVAFIMRNVNPSSNISGVFILPRVFSRLPGTDLIKANTYAALKEIEKFATIRDTDTLRPIHYGVDTIRIKRPPFDMTYIIDSVNERERVIDEVKILNARVAEGLYILIGSEIGTGNTNAIDNIKSHLASAGLVNQHSAGYCSFGVASCRWKAEKYKADYAMRQFASGRSVIEGLLSSHADAVAREDASAFVQGQRLGKAQIVNLLADRFRPTDLPTSFRIHIPDHVYTPEDGNDLRDVKYPRHVAEMRQKFKSLIGRDALPLAAEIAAAFDEVCNSRRSGKDYLTYREEFAKGVAAGLLELRDELDRKSLENEAKLSLVAKEFDELGERIEQAKKRPSFWKRWWWRESVSKNMEGACANYNGAVENQCKGFLLREQLTHSRDLAQSLWAHADSVVKECSATRAKMKTVLDGLEAPGQQAGTKGPREDPFEYTLQSSLRPPELKTTTAEFVAWCVARHGSVYSFIQQPDEKVKEGILEFVSADNVELSNVSIDDMLLEALKHKGAGEQNNGHGQSEYQAVKGALDQLSYLAAPLWRFNAEEIPLTRKNINTKLSYCGVPDSKEPVPAKQYSGSWLNGDGTNFVETIDPHRIIFFNITFGVPLFALQGIKEMEHEYFAKRDTVPCHLSKRWNTDASLVPKQVNSVMGTFALAVMPDFSIITADSGKLYSAHLKDSNGAEKTVKLDMGLKPAFKAFSNKLNVVQEVSDAIGIKIEEFDQAKLKEMLQDYKEWLTNFVAADGAGSNGHGNGSHQGNGGGAKPDAAFNLPLTGEDEEFLKDMAKAVGNFDKEIGSF